MPKYLGQTVAIEADIRKMVMRDLTDAYHALDKPNLMEGMHGEYEAKDDDGLELQPEDQRVQATVKEMVDTTKEKLTQLFDATAARDFTNSSGTAKADVVVGETVLVADAPIPYLLWLDRKLDEIRAFATRIPTLSASTEWTLDNADRGIYKSTPVVTLRQTQQAKVIPVFQPTDKHPGQAQVIQEPVVEGRWTRVKFSGAMPVSEREQILRRISNLKNAVHAAREKAKRVESLEPVIGEGVLNYIFG
jgi:hypothetical protein